MRIRAVLPALLLFGLACDAKDPIPKLQVEAIHPSSATRGDPVVLRGENLDMLSSLRVGETPVERWARRSDEEVAFRVPTMAQSGVMEVVLGQDEVDDDQRVSFEVRDRKGVSWHAVEVGAERTCAVTTDARLFCWGEIAPGDGYPGGTYAPVEVTASAANTGWSELATMSFLNQEDTCARDAAGELWCWPRYASWPERIPGEWSVWGLSFQGLCGRDGDPLACHPLDNDTFSTSELVVAPSLEWRGLAYGGGSFRNLHFRFCGITSGDELWCFDGTDLKQKGDGHTWTDVVVGKGGTDFGCALRDGGRLWCWGTGPATPDGTVETTYPLMELYPWGEWTALDAGPRATCGIRQGQLYCWGWNTDLVRTADAFDDATVYPERIGVQSDWSSVSVGTHGACGIKQDGTLWCWGRSPLPGSEASAHPRPYQVQLR